jgi:hypothetical protein
MVVLMVVLMLIPPNYISGLRRYPTWMGLRKNIPWVRHGPDQHGTNEEAQQQQQKPPAISVTFSGGEN